MRIDTTRAIAAVFCAAVPVVGIARSAPASPKLANVAIPARTFSASTATATLIPFSTIGASIQFTDTGSTLTVSGTGTGFNAGLSYTSFFYGTGSVPTGSLACFPPNPNLLTAKQMITARWLPRNATSRTLTVVKSGASYVSLSKVATFSVRYDSTPNLPLMMNLNPGRFWLNSCGAITTL